MTLAQLLAESCRSVDHPVAVVAVDGTVLAASPAFAAPLHPLPRSGVAPEGGRDLLVLPVGELRLVVELPAPVSAEVSEAATQLRRLSAAGRRQREELAGLLAHEANSPLAALIADLGFVRAALDAHGRAADAGHDPGAAEALAEALVDAEAAAHRVRDAVRRLQARVTAPAEPSPPAVAPPGARAPTPAPGTRSDGDAGDRVAGRRDPP